MKIAVASGKGGTGKTTLSTNLAALLAEERKTVLADLDVEEPNSGLFIHGKLFHEVEKYKMVPEWDESNCSFCGKCQEACNFHAVINIENQIMLFPQLCHSCHACSELCPSGALPMKPHRIGVLKHFRYGRLSFIESRLDIGQEQAVPLIRQTNDYLSLNFNENDIILLDAPPGTSCPVIEATKDTDLVVLVTEPTPFGLHDLKLAAETMKILSKKFAVVINRYGIGNEDVEEYCEQQNIEILAKIPNIRKIAELYSSGKLIYNEVAEFREAMDKIILFIHKHEKEISK